MKDAKVSVVVVDDEAFPKAMRRTLAGARPFASFRSSSESPAGALSAGGRTGYAER